MDTLKNLVWIIAVVIGLFFLSGRRVTGIPKIMARIVSAATAGTTAFVAANLAVVLYILANVTDSRWSAGRDGRLESPEIPSVPFMQPVTDTLNGVMGGLVGGVNDAIAMKNAFFIIPEFVGAAVWAAAVLAGLAIANRILAAWVAKEETKQIERNTRDLADIRAQLGLAPFQDSRVGAR